MHIFQAAPVPQTFNPEEFLNTLTQSGPQLTSSLKGDWEGLYKRFFRSANFNGWFNERYTNLTQKLQALQLEALADAVIILIHFCDNNQYSVIHFYSFRYRM